MWNEQEREEAQEEEVAQSILSQTATAQKRVVRTNQRSVYALGMESAAEGASSITKSESCLAMLTLSHQTRLVHIGIDDTDSKDGMCTTYVGAVVLERLERIGVRHADYPNLVRLNPNWPLKTRGNCAIAIRARIPEGTIKKAKETVLAVIRELAEIDCPSTNPGAAFYQGEVVPDRLKLFSKKVVQDIASISEAEAVAEEVGAEVKKFRLGRGIIGALAAIGATLESDRTFELVAYRAKENWGTRRRIDPESVVEMNTLTYPQTFDNVDPRTGEIRITPHTPCPILYGIRAESGEAALRAHRLVRSLEPIERVILYKTNQGTDQHIQQLKIVQVRPLLSVAVEGVILEKPKVIPGGHVILRMGDDTGEIYCAAYEPTRDFRSLVRRLHKGDTIRTYGGAKQKAGLPLTINLEKITVLKLARITRKVNPFCVGCGRRARSEGRDKGYTCEKCKRMFPKDAATVLELERDVAPGEYEVPPRARRHLAKPLIRSRRSRSASTQSLFE